MSSNILTINSKYSCTTQVLSRVFSNGSTCENSVVCLVYMQMTPINNDCAISTLFMYSESSLVLLQSKSTLLCSLDVFYRPSPANDDRQVCKYFSIFCYIVK